MTKLACLLLVDDDQTTNYLNQLLLKRLDVAEQVLVALNGEEALAQLQAHCPAPQPERAVLVLLDVKMPVMDGFEFVEAFGQLPLARREDIVIIMLTTSLHPRDVERMQGLPIAGFLNKPLNRDKVDAILQEHFARRLPVQTS